MVSELFSERLSGIALSLLVAPGGRSYPATGQSRLSMLVTRWFIAQAVHENPPDFLGDWRFLPMDPRY